MSDFSHFSDGQTTYDVCDEVARQDLSSHILTSILSVSGIHGIRYDKDEKIMYYADPNTGWEEMTVGSGGHTIQNTSGTALEQRDNLQFKDMSVSDDSTNNKTIIRQTQVVATKAEWDAMTPDPNITYYLPYYYYNCFCLFLVLRNLFYYYYY